MKDYLNDRFEILGKKTPFKEPNPNDSTITKYGIRYSGNIDYYYFGEECSDIEVIKTKNITLQEAFLLISTFNPNFSDILINKSLRKGNGPKDLWIEQKPKREQYARSLTIEIGNDGEYKSMQICFDAEAGSGCVSVQRKNKDEIIIEFSYSCS